MAECGIYRHWSVSTTHAVLHQRHMPEDRVASNRWSPGPADLNFPAVISGGLCRPIGPVAHLLDFGVGGLDLLGGLTLGLWRGPLGGRHAGVRVAPRLGDLVRDGRAGSGDLGVGVSLDLFGVLGRCPRLRRGPVRLRRGRPASPRRRRRPAPTMTAQINRLELTGRGADRLAAGHERWIGFLAARFAKLADEERAAVAAALPALDKLSGAP
uniref:hypothetical protein n=1 Tax=Actinomadura sp. CA-154981 TaxID=3240037 RepID=UPI003F49431C